MSGQPSVENGHNAEENHVSRENRDAESAVVADLVAVELDDAGLNLNAKRLPILARIYGAVVLLDGLATLPIMVISILYAVLRFSHRGTQ